MTCECPDLFDLDIGVSVRGSFMGLLCDTDSTQYHVEPGTDTHNTMVHEVSEKCNKKYMIASKEVYFNPTEYDFDYFADIEFTLINKQSDGYVEFYFPIIDRVIGFDLDECECDSVYHIIHGRNINHIIRGITIQVIQLSNEEPLMHKDIIRSMIDNVSNLILLHSRITNVDTK